MYRKAIFVLIALLSLSLWAQTAPPPPNPGGPAGPRFGRRGPGMGPMAGLRNLNLSPDQKTKVDALMQQQHQQMQALHDNTSLTPDQRRQQAQDLRKNALAQLNSILTPEQQQQLKQMRGRARGFGRGFEMGRMAGRLNLTPEQKAQLQPIFEQHRSQLQALRDNTSLTPEQRRTQMEQLRKDMQTQINAVLTPEQQQQMQQFRQHRRGPRGGGPPPGPGPNSF